MTKKTVFYFVFDGLADWEASHALAGINKSNRFRVVTIGLDKNPKRSMAGVDILPAVDFIPWVDLRDIDGLNTAMLILPGGTGWNEKVNDGIADLVYHCISEQIPVAAIGDAATFLSELDIDTTDVIAANSAGAVDFAREVFEALQIAGDEKVRQWFQYFESLPA